jgi:hypothetical protein
LPVVVQRLTADSTRVLIEVWDDIPGAPAAGQADPDDDSGQDPMLIEAVCDRRSWATVLGWTGKVVSARTAHPVTRQAAHYPSALLVAGRT